MRDSRWNEAGKIRFGEHGLPDEERARKLCCADEAGMPLPPGHTRYSTLLIEGGEPVF